MSADMIWHQQMLYNVHQHTSINFETIIEQDWTANMIENTNSDLQKAICTSKIYFDYPKKKDMELFENLTLRPKNCSLLKFFESLLLFLDISQNDQPKHQISKP